MNLTGGPDPKMAVPPVIAAVTAAVLTLTDEPFGGTCIRIEPWPKLKTLAPESKLKTLFAPKRVSVLSVNVNSVRES